MAAGLLSLIVLPGIATIERGKDGLDSLTWGAGRLRLYETTYAVAGAGLKGGELRKLTFKPRWLPELDNNAFYLEGVRKNGTR